MLKFSASGKAKHILSNAFIDAENAELLEYKVRDEAIELLSLMDTKGLTLKHLDLLTQKAITAFSAFQEVDARVTPEIFEKGLHVHKLSGKSEDMIGKSNKVPKELKKIGERIETHYPQYSGRWSLIIERQNGVVEIAEKVKSSLISLFQGDASISLDQPPLI